MSKNSTANKILPMMEKATNLEDLVQLYCPNYDGNEKDLLKELFLINNVFNLSQFIEKLEKKRNCNFKTYKIVNELSYLNPEKYESLIRLLKLK